MLTEPVGQLAAIESACGEIEHKALLGIDGGIDLGAVEYQECLADSSALKSRMPAAPPVAWRRRRCSSTTSPSVTYRIRRGADIAPGSSAELAWQLPQSRRPESPADPQLRPGPSPPA
jgi:hypothetical protein